ncbi:lanthionine synthetase LanC family protein [Rheinheimera sp. MMS21-TC3]|uniref:lanthionine synthetase LanC family protein n=1 Tax=Rheinheimera sp. MMS21-TC3 TaxID=3072790 RepID=UPI0028C4296A|nr:lanthionine synthetase LanC family protein [Rheinheimera sp. MMS21-TC3]WNO59750.1 lanthionine synthetase LanC family protein [Rheinheimera sp. MMS21-TC3]
MPQKYLSDIVHVLDAINQDLQTADYNDVPPGIISGVAGHILFLYEYYQFAKKPEVELAVQQRFSWLEEQIEDLQDNSTFSYGLPGIGWLYEYLLSHQASIDPDSAYDGTVNNSTDIWLQTHILNEPWQTEIEFIQGIAGLAPYIARRAKYQPNHILIEKFLQQVELLSESTLEGLKWPTPEGSPYILLNGKQESEVNLGLAHGMPAILAALLSLAGVSSYSDRIKPLLDQGINWLYKQQQPIEVGSYYGYAVGENECSRLGWCYGDLPLALIFARAGRLLNNEKWLNFGKDIALHTSKRRDNKAGIRDAGLCHGSVGLALIFKLINEFYHLEELKSAQEYWLQDALQRFEKNGVEGLKPFREPGSEAEKLPTQDFLGGTSGVGLGLLALISNRQDWADALLLA